VCRELRRIAGVACAGRRRFVNGNDASILIGGRVVYLPNVVAAVLKMPILPLGLLPLRGSVRKDHAVDLTSAHR
jgi:hypothetical protein